MHKDHNRREMKIGNYGVKPYDFRFGTNAILNGAQRLSDQKHQFIWVTLVLALVYVISGKLSLMLALPPGFATPVFPAAGLALASAVVFRGRALPGLAIGAFLLNLLVASEAGKGLGSSLPLSLLISFASVMQAWLGGWLVTAQVRPGIDSGQDAVRFLLLVPLFCLTGATLAVSGLFVLGAMGLNELQVNWVAWWIGDTIGVLIGAPLTWIFIGRPRLLWRRRRWTLGVPLVLASTVLIGSYFKTSEWEQERQTERFRFKSQQVADIFQFQFAEHERFLRAMASVLNDPDHTLAPVAFQKMARAYLESRPELRSMSWAPHILGSQRAEFERWAQTVVKPGYRIRQVGSKDELDPVPAMPEYYPVTFQEPMVGNGRALGLDLLSEPRRASTVAHTIATRLPAASEPLVLVQDLESQRGGKKRAILMLQVVNPPETAARHDPIGMISLVLEMNTYLDRTLASAEFSGFLVRVDDVTAPLQPLPLVDKLQRELQPGDFQRHLSMGGRNYLLTLGQSALSKQQSRGWQSWGVLVFGLILTGLLGALLLSITGERARIETVVRERTRNLHEREARLQAILDHAADAILTIAPNGELVSSNAAASALFGYDSGQMQTLALERLLQLEAEDSATDLLQRLAMQSSGKNNGQSSSELELSGQHCDGHLFPLLMAVSLVDLTDEHFYVCILHDLSEQRRSQEQIYELAHHDPLTGLANRFMLNLRLEQLLTLCQREQTNMAVMFIDLDHFKKINDTHGHQIGDQLLVEVAHRLRDMVRDADTIARQGGDEFIVVLGGNASPDAVSQVAKRILQALAQPYHLGKLILHTAASIGVSMYPADSMDATTLLLHADTAMYAAKGQGRGNFQFFSEAMNTAIRERLLLESRLWLALEQQEFELYLQPQINLATTHLIGAEALLRWHHPELGMVPPDRFIPIAEESGLMLPLGEWVLARGISMLADWRQRGLPPLRLALNLSARQCHDGKLLPCLDRLLAEHQIDTALLELEITESAAMHDPEQTRQLLRELRLRGINVAIDDFGTGYSSLSYLKLFAIDRIKIDRSFVKDIETDPNDAVIVNTTIALAHSLGLEVIAEGVETFAQSTFLREHGCDEAQGYLFARPLPIAQFEQFVQSHMKTHDSG